MTRRAASSLGGHVHPLITRRNYMAVHAALHKLWTRAAWLPDYDKPSWKELDRAIDKLAHEGPGDPCDPLS